MVDSHSVEEFGAPSDALLPEGEDLFFVLFPVIQGVAPQLTVFGKGIGRHTGHRSQSAVLIQLEQFRVLPNLYAVRREVEGDVAHNADTILICILLQGEPLAVEGLLQEDVEAHFLLGGRGGILRPLLEGELITVVEGSEISIILQPGEIGDFCHVFRCIFVDGLFIFCRRFSGQRALPCTSKQGHAGSGQETIIYTVGIAPFGTFQFIFGQQAFLSQLVQVDQVGIAGERRGGHIRRGTISGGDQGKDLPIMLTGLGQKIHKFSGRCAHGTNAVRAGQRRNGQQNTAGAIVDHSVIPPVRIGDKLTGSDSRLPYYIMERKGITTAGRERGGGKPDAAVRFLWTERVRHPLAADRKGRDRRRDFPPALQ